MKEEGVREDRGEGEREGSTGQGRSACTLQVPMCVRLSRAPAAFLCTLESGVLVSLSRGVTAPCETISTLFGSACVYVCVCISMCVRVHVGICIRCMYVHAQSVSAYVCAHVQVITRVHVYVYDCTCICG